MRPVTKIVIAVIVIAAIILAAIFLFNLGVSPEINVNNTAGNITISLPAMSPFSIYNITKPDSAKESPPVLPAA